MRRHTTRALWMALAIAPVTMAWKAATAPLEMQPESRLWIVGSSSVRGFECRASAFDARIESAGQGAVLASGEQALANACRQAALERGALGEGCFEFAATRTLQLSISAGGGISSDLIPALYRTCMG